MSRTTMTLAFTLGSLDHLKDPAAVFADAREWSTHVGVVSDKMAYHVVNKLREQGIYDEDFFSRADKKEGLAHVRDRTDTDRHVFVGASSKDERIAEEVDWEYLSVEEAATEAGWELVPTPVGQQG